MKNFTLLDIKINFYFSFKTYFNEKELVNFLKPWFINDKEKKNLIPSIGCGCRTSYIFTQDS
jgi:hypothetical protein